ncbi:MAG: tryptophan synthase subunit alpha [Myxococcales bacterium]|nr:tryptophan synthase subunit alpha [Myxococcales bacterium]
MTGGPTRIARRFAALQQRGEKGLIVYLTCGDPSLAESAALVIEAAAAGADVIELGVPWSDPSSDGPVIQRAMERALVAGGTLRRTLEVVAEVRRWSEVPIVLFGYYNPILALGPERAAEAAARAGVDGLLTVDLALEEAEELDGPLRARGLDRIPLLAPTTTPERAARHAARGSGFAYYVSLTGVTGAGHLDAAAVGDRVRALRPALGSLPLAVGFGVKDAASARAVGANADAVVVGSALVQAIHDAQGAESRLHAVRSLVSTLKSALTDGTT